MNLRLFHRIAALFRRDKLDRELGDEVSAHLDLAIEENLKGGMTPQEARRHALIRFGGTQQTKEAVHEQRTLPFLETFLQDLRYGARMLRKYPAFTAVSVLTLALGIGANTAIFSVMRQVLLQRLPVPHPEQLVLLYSPGAHEGHTSSDEDGSESFSYPMYTQLRDLNSVFSGLAAKADFPVSVSFRGQTERTSAELVSGNYFQTLEVQPALGRVFDASDSPGAEANPVVVLDYGYWQNRFGGDPSVLNQSLLINDRPMTIVGVVQPGFSGIQPGNVCDLYIPITMKPVITPATETLLHRGLMNHLDYWAKLIGRLKPGISRQQAEAAVLPTYSALLREELPLNGGLSPGDKQQFLQRRIILHDGSRGRRILANDTRPELLMLMGMVGLVLFITCANVAVLLTARGAARQKEIGVRLSLGASRPRIIRQLVVESCLLSLCGALLGLFLAHWFTVALVQYAFSNDIASDLSTSLNVPVLGFTVGVALLSGIFFGLAPAWVTTRLHPASALKEQAGALSAARSQSRLRSVLVVSQVALTLLLVTGAYGFVRSLYNLKYLDLGFRPDHVLQFSVSPVLNGYDQKRSLALYDQLERKVAALPGVHSLAAAEIPLIADDDRGGNVTLPGLAEAPDVDWNCIGPDYFSNLGIPLIQGREFTPIDNEQAPKVAIVNEAFANLYFPGGRAIGKMMKFGGGPGPLDTEIVGVVRNSHYANIRETPRPFVYIPYRQATGISSLTFYIRTANDPAGLTSAVRSAVSELDANLPLYDVRPFEEQIDQSLSSSRVIAVLAILFGGLAAFLAAMGIYALLAYTVAQRTREIGIRMALGAQPRAVAHLVLLDVARLTLIGVLLGIPLSYAAGKVIDAQLFNVHSFAFTSIAIALAVLAITATASSYLPMRRAVNVDPVAALRSE